MNNTLKIVLTSALITAAAIKAAPVLAEPADTTIAVSVVQTSDLNLATAAGQRQLEVRLARAAREVCGSASDADLSGKNAVRECRDTVLAKVRAQGQLAFRAARPVTTIAVTASR